MKKIDAFTNQYSLSKTLRFKLIPVGKTEENFAVHKMLEEDEKRAESYVKVKGLIDSYHRFYIDNVLNKFVLCGVNEYSDLYFKSDKDLDSKDKMKKCEENMRKQISNALKSDERYSLLGKKDMIRKILPDFLEEESDKELVKEFYDFTTYFTGFFQNRENMYTDEDKSTGIAHRCINDNLPKFLDNVKTFKKYRISEALATELKILNTDFDGIYGTRIEDIFSVDYFTFTLSQSGIDKYNSIIGGYTNSDGSKIQGLNEYINLYNQQVAKSDKSKRLPQMNQLYKQILSEKNTISFIPEKFNSDDEVLKSIYNLYEGTEDALSVSESVKKLIEFFNHIDEYKPDGIYVKNGIDLTSVSNGAFDSWGAVQSSWEKEYDEQHGYKDSESYFEKRKSTYKKCESFSLSEIQCLGEKTICEDKTETGNVIDWLKSLWSDTGSDALKKYEELKPLLESEYTNEKRLFNNYEAIELIKNSLDSLKEFERSLKIVLGTGKEENKDEMFYGTFIQYYEIIRLVDSLYDKVRNYMTQKPYSPEKIKLNFENPQFLGGWDRNKESDYSSVLLEKDKNYYLAVMSKNNKKVFESIPDRKGEESVYRKMIYKLLPGPNKMLPKVFFSRKGVNVYKPSSDLLKKYNNGTHKAGETFNIDDCHNLIDFFKSSIQNHPDWSKFDFKFTDTSEYRNIGEFYNEVKNQGYKLTFCDAPASYIDSLVNDGKIYLFKIYNKDFSQHSNGAPNLHTMYFKMLFDERNLKNVIFKLNGESEMFYRRASIKNSDIVKHPANQAVMNKNVDNPKKESTFSYDLIKDKRYTVNQFSLHMPITLNFTAFGNENINDAVRRELKKCDNNYVIGIDRGERNLLYICVVDGNGKIVKQFSLNEIINEYNGVNYKTDYHKLLDKKEKERLDARKNWTAVENIKELKEGYISQVVHKICELVEKYDAVIAMEDLNSGFKNSRAKVEKSVYQKFEKMLIDKLNFYADKKKQPDEMGGILNAYQLTGKFESFAKMGKQNGFIFYVPAWLTSKIDPTTGFVDLMHPRYESVSLSKSFIEHFRDIAYNFSEDYFEFSFNYDEFPKCSSDYKKEWTICSYGKRIKTYRNPEKNGEYDNEEITLTDEFKKLFSEYSINISSNLKSQILSQTESKFFRQFISLLKLTLQMRNSETGTSVDYLISPVKNSDGEFYCSDDYEGENAVLPIDADANGAYHIAKKALWAIEQIKSTDEKDLRKVKLAISNKEWLEYIQR